MTPTQMILEATLHQKRITALLHRLLQVQVRAQLDFCLAKSLAIRLKIINHHPRRQHLYLLHSLIGHHRIQRSTRHHQLLSRVCLAALLVFKATSTSRRLLHQSTTVNPLMKTPYRPQRSRSLYLRHPRHRCQP